MHGTGTALRDPIEMGDLGCPKRALCVGEIGESAARRPARTGAASKTDGAEYAASNHTDDGYQDKGRGVGGWNRH
jgi:hypothetical protein